jgi:hypothetical protein
MPRPRGANGVRLTPAFYPPSTASYRYEVVLDDVRLAIVATRGCGSKLIANGFGGRGVVREISTGVVVWEPAS